MTDEIAGPLATTATRLIRDGDRWFAQQNRGGGDPWWDIEEGHMGFATVEDGLYALREWLDNPEWLIDPVELREARQREHDERMAERDRERLRLVTEGATDL